MADFDWGNLLYFAVIIALSILGGRKKKKAKKSPYRQSTNSTSESKTGFFEQILGEDLTKVMTSSESENTKPVFEHIYGEPSQESFVDNNEQVDFDKEKKPEYIPSRNRQIIREEPILAERSELLKDLDDFDLRKAVIYSEILAQKKY